MEQCNGIVLSRDALDILLPSIPIGTLAAASGSMKILTIQVIGDLCIAEYKVLTITMIFWILINEQMPDNIAKLQDVIMGLGYMNGQLLIQENSTGYFVVK